VNCKKKIYEFTLFILESDDFFLSYHAQGSCEPNPCKNGGSCTVDGTDYTCSCTSSFSGRDCESKLVVSLSRFISTKLYLEIELVYTWLFYFSPVMKSRTYNIYNMCNHFLTVLRLTAKLTMYRIIQWALQYCTHIWCFDSKFVHKNQSCPKTKQARNGRWIYHFYQQHKTSAVISLFQWIITFTVKSAGINEPEGPTIITTLKWSTGQLL
jgi:hypothetical protein